MLQDPVHALRDALRGADGHERTKTIFDLPDEAELERRCLARKAMAVLDLKKEHEALFRKAVEAKMRQIDMEMEREREKTVMECQRHQQAERDLDMTSADGLLVSVADILEAVFDKRIADGDEATIQSFDISVLSTGLEGKTTMTPPKVASGDTIDNSEHDSSASMYKAVKSPGLSDRDRPSKRKAALYEDIDMRFEEPSPSPPSLANSSSFLERDEEIPSRLPDDQPSEPSEPKSASSPIRPRHSRNTRSSTILVDRSFSCTAPGVDRGCSSRLRQRVSQPIYNPTKYYEHIGILGAKRAK